MLTDSKVNLKIATPAGAYEGTFQLTDQVSEVIATVVKVKNLSEGDAFELALNGRPLPPDSKLSDWNLTDGAVLDLIATGSAV